MYLTYISATERADILHDATVYWSKLNGERIETKEAEELLAEQFYYYRAGWASKSLPTKIRKFLSDLWNRVKGIF